MHVAKCMALVLWWIDLYKGLQNTPWWPIFSKVQRFLVVYHVLVYNNYMSLMEGLLHTMYVCHLRLTISLLFH